MPFNLESDAIDLVSNAQARRDKIFGRNEEVELLARTLSGKRSAILVGPSGVGKTAIIHKLAHLIQTDKLPKLAGHKLFELSTLELCADTRYTGMQEDRIKALLEQVTPQKLVYVSDTWNLPGAGSYDTNPRGIYELMRIGIEAEKLVIVGEMTEGRWKKVTREHPSFLRDFVKIAISETEDAVTREILARACADTKVAFDRTAIERVYALARRFLSMQAFPGKAVELVRRIQQAARPAVGEARREAVDSAFVEETFGKLTGLPLHMISPKVKKTYEDMLGFLEARVVGQAEAVTAVADVLALYKAGLKDPDRPAGVLLFVGPTGVGKTELAKATAAFLFGGPERMFRIDCTEFKDYHAFEKLIGDPRTNKPGTLTEHVRAQPFSVILLDEFEKAHTNLADVFLQLFDEGRLTDATGDTVDFRNTLIILTSNVGNTFEDQKRIGFSEFSQDESQERERRIRKALEGTYRPEFLNRIDRVLTFHALGREDLRRIARREVGKLYQREGFAERDLLLEIDEQVIDLVLDHGVDAKYGARPLKRAMERILVLPLARAVLGTEVRRFQLLRVFCGKSGVEIEFEDTAHSRKLESLSKREPIVAGHKVVRISLAEVRPALLEMRRRLLSLNDAASIPAMRKQVKEIERNQSSPAFWEVAFGRNGALFERHELQVELDRYQALWDRLLVLEKLVQASFDEVEDALADDLLAEYGRLLRDVERAELELVHFDQVARSHAEMFLRPGDAKPATASWVEALAKMYFAWGKARGYEGAMRREGASDPAVKRAEARSRSGVAGETAGRGVVTEGGVSEGGAHESGLGFVLSFAGRYAFGYLRGEAGTHRIITATPDAAEKRGETHLVSVTVTSDDASSRARVGAVRAVTEGDPTMDTNRNRPDTAVEPAGGQATGSVRGAKQEPGDSSPVRVYDLWQTKAVKDRRTGHVEGDTRAVLEGKIEGFLEAMVRTGRASSTAE